jgi:hypothetical protein
MWLIDWTESRFKKGQFAFDLAVAVIIVSFILYFGLTTVAEIHNSSKNSLEEQILFNKILAAADYLVKEGAVETKEIFQGSKAIYHHQLTSFSFSKVDKNELKDKLQLKEIYIDFCPIEGCSNISIDSICVNRIILFEGDNSILRVCGK